MMEKRKVKQISGWYAKGKLSPDERAARTAEVNDWYEKRHKLNYRTVPVEIPGKMMAALGELALQQRVAFSEFIEDILEDYLKNKGIHIDYESS